MTKFIHRIPKIFLALLLVLFLTQCQEDRDSKLAYKIGLATLEGKPALDIQMKFNAHPSGITKVLYDNDAWGEKDLFNCIAEVRTEQPGVKIDIKKDSSWLEITHPKELKQIDFHYKVQQDFEEKGERGESYRPIIQEDYFHVFSHNLFMIPEHLGKEADNLMNVELRWENFPEDYVIHNSFGTSSKKQHLNNVPLSEFHQAIFIGGDFRIHSDEIRGNNIYLASRGDWVPFKDTTVMKILSRTIEVQRDFWKDHSQQYFTVTMRPIKQERGSSFQGTGLTNSFATSISNNSYTDVEQLVYLFNHELQHNWIGHAIENSNEEEQYWFSEGFTEYYTIKNIAKHRIHQLDESYFITQLNEIIRNLYTSPVKEAPNSQINYDNFWSDRDYSKLPYYRGAIFAFYLDQLIHADSEGKNNLDDLMHDLLKGAVEEHKKITHKYFIATVNKYLNGDIGTFFKDHIENGKLFPLEDVFMNIGFEYCPTTEVFDLGFRLAEDQRQISWVDKESAAYKAGLREGDQLGSRSIYYGNTENPVELGLLQGKTQKNISYLPAKMAKVPQLLTSEKNIELLSFRR
ncbi:MAG: M1 family aminopeptidase [Flavobacteriaceae bacterium]